MQTISHYSHAIALPRPVVLEPPQEVLDHLAAEEARIGTFSPEARQRCINEWTLGYYFRDYPGIDVAFRDAPTGVELLGLGFEEVTNVRRTLGDGPGCNITFRQL